MDYLYVVFCNGMDGVVEGMFLVDGGESVEWVGSGDGVYVVYYCVVCLIVLICESVVF